MEQTSKLLMDHEIDPEQHPPSNYCRWQPTCELRWRGIMGEQKEYQDHLQQKWTCTTYEKGVAVACFEEWRLIPLRFIHSEAERYASL